MQFFFFQFLKYIHSLDLTIFGSIVALKLVSHGLELDSKGRVSLNPTHELPVSSPQGV